MISYDFFAAPSWHPFILREEEFTCYIMCCCSFTCSANAFTVAAFTEQRAAFRQCKLQRTLPFFPQNLLAL